MGRKPKSDLGVACLEVEARNRAELARLMAESRRLAQKLAEIEEILHQQALDLARLTVRLVELESRVRADG
ncbi:putative trypsin-like protein [Aeropyrum globular virus 1]|uniref:putative trypsin-like protein n=1 Tax=Aeropyrum globular virus 1 TaxID=1932713 RepID=UPI000C7EC664|nr:putative trypsin-like protein [Aeropyrum globular virus 1]BBC20931.1 putative trypsin-like protein [Aeropyrum globular virus 1]